MDYIIPYRASTKDRETALHVLLQYLRDKPVNPVVIEDQGDGLFNRGRLINQGVKASKSEIVWLADNDILVNESTFLIAIEHLTQVSIYKPFFKKIYDVPLDVFQSYANGSPRSEDFPLRGGLGLFSGVTVITKEAFLKIGGFDESFIGWGGEDYAMARIAFMMQIPTHSDDLPAYHFAHRRLEIDTWRHPHYQDNVKLWKEYEQASKEEILDMANRNFVKNFTLWRRKAPTSLDACPMEASERQRANRT